MLISLPKIAFLGGIKLIKNAVPDRCSYSGYGIAFDSRLLLPYPRFD